MGTAITEDFFHYKQTLLSTVYADKSLFIKQVFEDKYKKILITTPASFGKTTTLRNLKRFIEIPITKAGLFVQETEGETSENYKFFKQHQLKIFRQAEFFQQNFASYLTVYVNLKTVYGANFREVVNNCRLMLCRLFKQFEYLKTSDKLNDEERNQFKKYFLRQLTRILTKSEIIEGLGFLCDCLAKHFDYEKRVFLLIDNYDCPISRLVIRTHFNSIPHVFYLFREIFSNVLNNRNVERAVLMGKHDLDVFKSDVSLGRYLFLVDEHPFSEFNGLSESELFEFLTLSATDPLGKNSFGEMLTEFLENYEGYGTDKKQFPIYSVLCFLNNRKLSSDIRRTFPIKATIDENAFMIPIIRYTIEKLCLKQSFRVGEILKRFELKHCLEFRDMLSGNSDFQPTELKKPDLFLTYLLFQGCLNYDSSSGEVKLVNKTVIDDFREQLNKFYRKFYEQNNLSKLNQFLNEIVPIFNKISPKWSDFENIVSKFNEHLSKFSLKDDKFDGLLFDILCKSNFSIGKEGLSFTKGKVDLVFCKKKFVIFVQVTKNECANLGLEQVIEKFGDIVIKDKCWFVKKFLVNQRIYLGLTINENKTVNLNVLENCTDLTKAKCY